MHQYGVLVKDLVTPQWAYPPFIWKTYESSTYCLTGSLKSERVRIYQNFLTKG